MRRPNAWMLGGLLIPLGAYAWRSPATMPLAAPSAAADLLGIESSSLTEYQAGTTPLHLASPQFLHRATQVDGSSRASMPLGMDVTANSLASAWQGECSMGGVDLRTGSYHPTDIDIALPASGTGSWLIGRNYNAAQVESAAHHDADSIQGWNWGQLAFPEIVLYEEDAPNADALDKVYLVAGVDRYVEFKRNSTNDEFDGRQGAAGVFQFVAGTGSEPDTYVLTDLRGTEYTFYSPDHGVVPGQIWKWEDAAGNVAYVGDEESAADAITSGFHESGRILVAYDAAGRRFSFSYTGGRLTDVLVEVKTGGTWDGALEVGHVQYGYYGEEEAHGTEGDLKLVTVSEYGSNSTGDSVRKRYYRYYKGSYHAETNPGHAHALKYAFDFEGTRRFDWGDGGAESPPVLDDGFLTADDEDLEPYAAAYFEYDSSRRIRAAWFSGECGCGGGGDGLHQYTYETNPGFTPATGYQNDWERRTIVARPDGSYLVAYFDEVGQALHKVIAAGDPASTNPVYDRWVTRVERNGVGLVTEVHTPAANLTYVHDTSSSNWELTSKSAAGLIWTFGYESSGPMTGFLKERKHRQGTGGTQHFQDAQTYTSTSITIGSTSVTRPFTDLRKSFHGLSTDGSTGFDAVDHDYTFYSGTLIPELVTTKLPAVATANNGSNSVDSAYRHLRLDGRVDSEKSPRGRLTYREYVNGQLTVEIEDADSAATSEYVGGSFPGGFSSGADPLHHRTVHAYDAQGRRTTTTLPNGRVTSSFYTKLGDARRVTLSFPKRVAGSPDTLFGPVGYTVRNLAGRIEAQGVIGLTSGSSTDAVEDFIDPDDADPIAAVDVGTLVRLRTTLYSESGAHVEEQRVYFDIPSSGAGTAGTNFDVTRYHEDDMGRVVRVVEPSGTIRRTTYDALGRVESRWMGTDDTGWAGSDLSGTDNLVRTELLTYDGGSPGGNSHLTERRLYLDNSSYRAYAYTHDLRGRVLLETNPTSPHAMHAYDNLGRRTSSGSFGPTAPSTPSNPTSTTTARLALSESHFDERGQVWKTVRHEIDASDGSTDDTLDSLTWYDADGNVIKVKGSQLAKTRYDGLGRKTHEFVLGKDLDSNYATASALQSGDFVLEEHQTTYESDGSNVLMEASIARRHHDRASGTVSTTGALDTNADADPLKYTAANVLGRIQISAMWYDVLDRLVDEVQFGTYDDATFDRGSMGSAPARSDTALRTSYAYGLGGELLDVTDPRALVQRTERDDAGRVLKAIRNYDGNVNSGNPSGSDDNVTVRYEYENGLRTKLIADLPSPATDQVTTYTYGTTVGTPAASTIATGHLRSEDAYPDSASSSDVVSYAYNAQGEEVRKKDQAGNVFETVRDDAGRVTLYRVETLATGFDGHVRRRETAYDDLGRPSTVVQWSAATGGSERDGVKYTYDGWGNVTSYRQDANSAVDASGSVDDYEVTYTWVKATSARNALRRSSIGLPSGASVSLNYRSANGLFDDAVSRVTSLTHGTTAVVGYDYLGLGQVVGTDYPEPWVRWRLYEGSTSGVYADLDRFGRVVHSRWLKHGQMPIGMSPPNIYHVELGYDENSNIVTAKDHVHAGFDVLYKIDGIDHLTRAHEGSLVWDTNEWVINDPTRDQQWSLDQVGNWERDKLDLDGDTYFTGTDEWDDCRTHNDVNEILTRDLDCTAGTTGDNYSLSHDAAGNLTDDGKDYKYVYDAFYRLRKVLNRSNDDLISEHRYNGLGHRIAVHADTDDDGDVDGNDDWEYLAYDERWRLVARFIETETAPRQEFVHHQAGLDGHGGSSYIDLVALRDRDTNANGTLDERIYYCQNWRADVSALVTDGGEMLEWVKYSAYGVPFGLPAGDTDSDGDRDQDDRDQIDAWAFASHYDVRGDLNLDGLVDSADKTAASGDVVMGRGVLNGESGERGFGGHVSSGPIDQHWLGRNRWQSPSVGRWMSRDPLEHIDGVSLYEYVAGRSIRSNDPFGLAAQEMTGDYKTEVLPECPPDADCEGSCVVLRLGDCEITDVEIFGVTGACPPDSALKALIPRVGCAQVNSVHIESGCSGEVREGGWFSRDKVCRCLPSAEQITNIKFCTKGELKVRGVSIPYSLPLPFKYKLPIVGTCSFSFHMCIRFNLSIGTGECAWQSKL